jgi:hypothetical protein
MYDSSSSSLGSKTSRRKRWDEAGIMGSCGSSLSDDGGASWSSSPQSSRRSSLANTTSYIAAEVRGVMSNPVKGGHAAAATSSEG